MVKKGYKQTEVGVIPEDWEDEKLGELAKVCMCKRIFADQTTENGEIPFFKIGTFGKEADAFISRSLYEELKQRFSYPQKGDVLISAAGTLGRSVVFDGKDSYFQDSNIVWLDVDKEKLSNEYLYHYYKVIQWASSEGSTIARLYNGIICDTHIALPKVDEQEQIAGVLSEIDELIFTLEKQISKKKAIKQGAMQELLTGKKRLPGFEGEWETRALHEISTEMVDGPFGSNLKTEHYTTERQVRIIQLSNIGEAGWNDANVKYTTFSHAAELQRCIVQPGSILIAKMMPAGRAIICPNNEKGYILGSDVVKVVPNSSVDSRYLVYATKSQFYLNQIADDTQGSTRARTSVSKLRKTAILFPTKDEQIAIANILSEMDMEIAALEEKLAKYRQVKQGMMQQLLTGKIRLKNDVVDSVHTEQKASAKKSPVMSAHNRQFDDAVSIAAIVDAFYSDKYPLGRVKVQKLLYLLHRHQAVSVSDFKKKAAGPYADTVRYRGGEPIAKKNKYIVSESGKQGTRYSKGKNMAQALDYIERWGMQADFQWLKENFLHTSRNDLELYATVDMAMCDLNEVGISVSVESIKNLIASNKEWKAKLSKTYFSDWDIARAIKKCTELFN